MKRIASFSAALLLSLAASTARASPRAGLGLPTSCAGLSAGAACDDLGVGVCAPPDGGAGGDGGADGGADGGSDGGKDGGEGSAADGGDAGALVCSYIPLSEGCDGKPIEAICLTGGAEGVCSYTSDGGLSCQVPMYGDDAGVASGSGAAVGQDGGVPGGADGGSSTVGNASSSDDGGCAIGSPDVSMMFSVLGLLVPLTMRRRRRG